jgi:hypothetical protein
VIFSSSLFFLRSLLKLKEENILGSHFKKSIVSMTSPDWEALATKIETDVFVSGDPMADSIKALDFNNLDFQASGSGPRKGLNYSYYFADPVDGPIVGQELGQTPLFSYYKEHLGISSFSSATLANPPPVINRGELNDAVMKHKISDIIDWTAVANEMNGKRLAGGQVTPMLPIEYCAQYRSFHRHGSSEPSIQSSKWSSEEDARLLTLAKEHDERDWVTISTKLGPSRTPIECIKRYQQVLNPNVIKVGDWSLYEESLLRRAVGMFGQKNWQMVSSQVPGRAAYQCQLKWRRIGNVNAASDKDKNIPRWTEEEERRLFLSAASHGMIFKEAPKRTAEEISAYLLSIKSGKTTLSAAQKRPLAKSKPSVKTKKSYTWQDISKLFPGKSDTRCRDKWMGNLDHGQVFGGDWTTDEDLLLKALAEQHGTETWIPHAEWLPGRTERQVATRWMHMLKNSVDSGVGSSSVAKKRRKVLTPAMGRKLEASKLNVDDFVPVLKSGK